MSGDDNAMDPISALVAAIGRLEAAQPPMSDGLGSAWPDLGRKWIVLWAVELGRDLRLSDESLRAAAVAGAGAYGVAHIEIALWRFAAGREKFHAVIAPVLGVKALRLLKRRRGIRRFEPDPRANRQRLAALASEHAAAGDLLALEEALAGHRFHSLRNQLTHSLAPILEWRSLMWFEVAEVKRGGVIDYQARNLEPARELQGAIPQDELFARTISDGHEATGLLTEAAAKLAELVDAVGALTPPPILWRAQETGELFFDREAAVAASRHASGLPPLFGSSAD